MIFDKLFHLMAEKQASDIFVTAGAPIQIKIQGTTIPINQQIMDPATIQRMAYEMMTPEQAKKLEDQREMNLSFGIREVGNFRVNVFWQRGSIAIVVRFIQGVIPSLDSLGLPPVLQEIIVEKRGLVLVCGATGSGKSTTIAAMLDYRNQNRTGHILTVEDPIEYLFRHKKSIVNQREIGMDTLSWGEALKNAMRQAPDCILIGEIRDRDGMDYGIAFAETGHLCLSTLHANNANQALDRIINFFPMDRRSQLLMDLSLNLKAVVSQRLIPKIGGGRVPAIEIMICTPLISDLVLKGEVHEIKPIMAKSRDLGMQTFDQSLFDLCVAGQIEPDVALRHADSPNDLRLMLKLKGGDPFKNDDSAGGLSIV